MGMDPHSEKELLHKNIETYLGYLEQNVESWKHGNLPNGISLIRVPQINDASVAKFGVLGMASEQERIARAKLAEERAKHKGYPNLNNARKVGLSFFETNDQTITYLLFKARQISLQLPRMW